MRRLAVADAHVDVLFERIEGGAVALTGGAVDGRCDVVVEPSTPSPHDLAPTVERTAGDPAT